MIDHDVMPMVAIIGGSTMLVVLVLIGLWRSRRRADRASHIRMTSFHMAVIDPRIAEQGRAAWERSGTSDGALMHAEQPRRFARGSTPGIATTPCLPTPALPARPQGWELTAPSVTARLRAVRRP